jgi:hypothetical protein
MLNQGLNIMNLTAISYMNLSESQKLELLQEESWGKQVWFAWYPVKIEGKWVWGEYVVRETFCLRMSGNTRTEYSFFS